MNIFCKRPRPPNIDHHQGMTLVELMVALVLGLMLTGIVVTMYLGFIQSSRTANQIARIQENTRFANSFLQKDLREAGYAGCNQDTKFKIYLDQNAAGYSDELFNIGFALAGWEYTGSGPDATNPVVLTDSVGIASDWTLIDASGITVNMNDAILALGPLAGSDVIVAKSMQELDTIVDTVGAIESDSIDAHDPDIITQHDIPKGQVVIVGDCNEADVFQNVNIRNADHLSRGQGTGVLVPGNDLTSEPWSNFWGPEHNLYGLQSWAYYVALGVGGIPSLFRVDISCGLSPDGECSTIGSELVEGVENMQVMYGVDTDGDLVANQYVTAAGITPTAGGESGFNDVVSVRISLLMRSLDNGQDIIDTEIYNLGDGIPINPIDSRLIRITTNATIHLRNMGV